MREKVVVESDDPDVQAEAQRVKMAKKMDVTLPLK